MKIKTEDLEGAALDWAVAKCEGYFDDTPSYIGSSITGEHFKRMRDAEGHGVHWTHGSTDWGEGGPIIDREGITIIRCDDDYGVDRQGYSNSKHIPVWGAATGQFGTHTSYEGEHYDPQYQISESEVMYGPTPLIAAMRCYVASSMGPEINIPDEFAPQQPARRPKQ